MGGKGAKVPIAVSTDSDQHVGRSAGYYEVEKPLCCSRHSDVERPQSGSGNFGDVDPAHGTPAPLEETCKQENAHQGKVSRRRYRHSVNWGADPHIQADVQHSQALRDGSPEKRATTTQRVGGEEKERSTSDHFHDSVNASSEELGGVSFET